MRNPKQKVYHEYNGNKLKIHSKSIPYLQQIYKDI